MSRQSIIDTAASQSGTVEAPPNSNKTKYGVWYGLNGVKWCCIFVSWVYDQAGNHLETIDTKNGYQSCQSGYVFWKRNNCIVHDPQPADIVLYDWNGDGICDHTGIFVKWLDDAKTTFQAWEGNTSVGNNSDGGQVLLRTRKRVMVRAFVTPKALNEATPVPQDDDLKSGDVGGKVPVLQRMLHDLGFDLTVDGNFGPQTMAAVNQFQQQQNLAVTGIVTPELFGLIQEEDSLPNVPGKKFTTGSYLQKGASGEAVLEVQQALNAQGANPKVAEDGVFGSSTTRAVTAYQQQNGLDVDGIVGPDTFAKLGITEV